MQVSVRTRSVSAGGEGAEGPVMRLVEHSGAACLTAVTAKKSAREQHVSPSSAWAPHFPLSTQEFSEPVFQNERPGAPAQEPVLVSGCP